jgi:hypothetical protein
MFFFLSTNMFYHLLKNYRIIELKTIMLKNSYNVQKHERLNFFLEYNNLIALIVIGAVHITITVHTYTR